MWSLRNFLSFLLPFKKNINELTIHNSLHCKVFIYKSNLFNGVCFDKNSRGVLIHESVIMDGKQCGISKKWYKNGNTKEVCYYSNGKKNGLSKLWFTNGQISHQSYYKNGLKHGLSKKWYNNGQLKYESVYKNDKLEGLNKVWDEIGKQISNDRVKKD